MTMLRNALAHHISSRALLIDCAALEQEQPLPCASLSPAAILRVDRLPTAYGLQLAVLVVGAPFADHVTEIVLAIDK